MLNINARHIVKSIISSYISPGKIFIFSITGCPYCDKAKQLMGMIKSEFGYVVVNTDPNTKSDTAFVDALHKHSGIDTYPKVYIGTKCYGGFSDVNELYKSGSLYKILKDEGIGFTERVKV